MLTQQYCGMPSNSTNQMTQASSSSEKSLFEKYNEALQEQHQTPKRSLITKGLINGGGVLKNPAAYAQPFCDFLTENPTVFHAVSYFERKLEVAGFKKVGSHPMSNLTLYKACYSLLIYFSSRSETHGPRSSNLAASTSYQGTGAPR